MFDKFNRLAEAAATNVSRRRFLGRLGRGAMALAASLGGLLAMSPDAMAARAPRMCETDFSFPDCQGMPVGSPCIGADGREGKCYAGGEVAPGTKLYYCGCRVPGRKDRRDDR